MITECDIDTMRLWANLAFRDLDIIEITLSHMREKEPASDINKKIQIIEKYLTLGNKGKILSKEEYARTLTIMRLYTENKKPLSNDESKYIMKQILLYFSHLDVQLQSIEKAVEKGFDFFPRDIASSLKETSGRLMISLLHSNKNRLFKNQKIVLDYITSLDLGMNITSIANALSFKYRHGYSIANTWFMIEALENAGFIRTVGGRKYGTRDRYCFPDLTKVNRESRHGKEEIIWGSAEEDISHILDLRWTRYFGIHIFEFNSNYDPEIYVISKYKMPLKEDIRTVGIFYKGSLENHIQKNFGLRLTQEGKKYSNEDSLIAYAVWDKNERLKWYDQDNHNAQRFSTFRNNYIIPDSALVVP